MLSLNMGKKATIADVARLSRVSKTTVSRFLNGKFENISQQTRERIQTVIDELDYHPDPTAQRLKASRSMLIGCIIGDVSSPFSALLLKGIMGACEVAGYQVLFADCADDPCREKHAAESLIANRVDGLIVNTAGGNEELYKALKNRGTPVVLADRGLLEPGQIDTVTIPNRTAAFDCVRMLRDCGYDRVAFFTEGNKLVTPRILRCEGYCDAVRELFPQGTEPEIYEFDKDDEASCQKELLSFLQAHPGERLAILTVNGISTQQLMLAAKSIELEFGRDVGLCGFDDWNWLQLAPSGISSVAAPTLQMGKKAAELLLERIDGRRPADAPAVQIELPVKIVLRGSVVREETPSRDN